MSAVKIMFHSVEDMVKFAKEVSYYEGDVDLQYETQVIDAKSIVGIMSLGIGQPLNLKIHNGNQDELLQKIGFCRYA